MVARLLFTDWQAANNQKLLVPTAGGVAETGTLRPSWRRPRAPRAMVPPPQRRGRGTDPPLLKVGWLAGSLQCGAHARTRIFVRKDPAEVMQSCCANLTRVLFMHPCRRRWCRGSWHWRGLAAGQPGRPAASGGAQRAGRGHRPAAARCQYPAAPAEQHLWAAAAGVPPGRQGGRSPWLQWHPGQRGRSGRSAGGAAPAAASAAAPTRLARCG